MPVLVTITAVTYLFLRGSKGVAPSLLAPAALRRKLEELPEESTRRQALAIADQLDSIAREYDQATDSALAAYVDNVAEWTSSASSLAASLEPHDELRGRVLRDLVQLRQSLLELLSPEEWNGVFE